MKDEHTPEMYESHRARLRDLARTCGTEALSDRKLLELFLFDLLPRVDTYPTAHRLLDTFKSMGGVFSASREELLAVRGIGPKSADGIIAAGRVVERIVIEHLTRAPLNTEARIATLLHWIMRLSPTDEKAVISFDRRMNYAMHRIFPPMTPNYDVRSFFTSEISRGYERFVLAHRHPEGYNEATPEDIAVTEEMSLFVSGEGGELVRHFIVAGNRVITVEDGIRSCESTEESVKDGGGKK